MSAVSSQRTTLRRSWTAVAAAFSSHAVIAGLLGPWMPDLKDRTGIDDGGLGLALAGYAAGLFVGTRLAGPLVRAIGGRAVVRAGIPAMAVAAALLPAADGLATLTAIFVAIGLASGCVDVAMNIEAVDVERRFGRRVMTAIHGAWSVSLFVGAGISSLGVAAAVPISVHLPISAGIVTAVAFPILRWLPRGDAGTLPTEGADADDVRRRGASTVALLGLIAGSSFLLEGVAMEWSAVYLRDGLGAAGGTVGLAVVVFSAGMAASRFIGDRLVGRLGQPIVVRIGAGMAVMSLTVMLLVPSVALSIVAFGVVGLGMGPVVPLAFRSAGWTARTRGDTALPIVVTAGYTGSIVGPALVGPLADAFGLRIAFVVPVVACAVVAVAAQATVTTGPPGR
jgi:MFS family permease